jgi:hypothetical protein
MPQVNLPVGVLYAGRTYGPGPVESDDLPEGALESFEAKGLLEEDALDRIMFLHDPSSADPAQPMGNPPSGEIGDADLTEAPPSGLVIDTRPSLPGSLPYQDESDETPSQVEVTSTSVAAPAAPVRARRAVSRPEQAARSEQTGQSAPAVTEPLPHAESESSDLPAAPVGHPQGADPAE